MKVDEIKIYRDKDDDKLFSFGIKLSNGDRYDSTVYGDPRIKDGGYPEGPTLENVKKAFHHFITLIQSQL